MESRSLRISIVGHGLRAGGGISVGKNFIASLTRAMPEAVYQIFVPANLEYERCATLGVEVEWQNYHDRFGKLGRWRYDQFELSARIRRFLPSVVICLGNVGVRERVAPQVLLLQDAHYFYPEFHYAREPLWMRFIYRYLRFRFSRDLDNTSVLLCQTKTAAERVVRWYGFQKNVALIPNVISQFSLEGAEESLQKGYRNPRAGTLDGRHKFRLFYLSRYYPHKNFEIFLDLFEGYRAQLADVEIYITIAPEHHPLARTFLREIDERGLGGNIINLGPIDQQDIAAHFSAMDALVMPSTLESFSGTYLEAMAFGCPILTSDLDFAHEVCRDAALYFNPWSVSSLFGALQRLMSEPSLAQTLIEDGRKIFAEMHPSWEQNAGVIKDVIDKLTNNSHA